MPGNGNPIKKGHDGSFIIKSEAEAIAALTDKPQGWGARPTPHAKNSHNRIPFETVPPERRHIAQQKLDDLITRWMHNHPGQTMNGVKRASLYGNAANYAKHRVIIGTQFHKRMRTHARRAAAIRFLAKQQLDKFRAQPLSRRVKRTI